MRMTSTSAPSADDLTARLRRKTEQNRETGETVRSIRQEAEELATNELRQLGASLSSAASAELRTFATATAAARKRQSALLAREWIRPLLIGIALLAGILIGSWGLTHYLAARIQSQIQRIEVQRRLLDDLESRTWETWGIELAEWSTGKYLILPAGAEVLDQEDRPTPARWITPDGRRVVKLALP